MWAGREEREERKRNGGRREAERWCRRWEKCTWHREERARQSLAADVTDYQLSLDTVSCLLALLLLHLYMSFNLKCCLFVLSVPVNLILHIIRESAPPSTHSEARNKAKPWEIIEKIILLNIYYSCHCLEFTAIQIRPSRHVCILHSHDTVT